VNGVLLAESAILLHFETIGIILLVLHGVVVSLLALGASQSDFNAHNGTSLKLPPCITPARRNLVSGQLQITAPKLKWACKIARFTGKIHSNTAILFRQQLFSLFFSFFVL
jgi:hypothetical protein